MALPEKVLKRRWPVYIIPIIILPLFIIAVAGVASTSQDSESKANIAVTLATEEQERAKDLAKMTGLSYDEVTSLYGAKGDWDQVTTHIFLYKQILNTYKALGIDNDTIFTLIADYSPDVILTVFEYASENKISAGTVSTIFSEYGKGADLGTLLSSIEAEEKTYTVYRPAIEEEIRQWLQEGYLPEEILSADATAREKDITLAQALTSKAKSHVLAAKSTVAAETAEDTSSTIKINKNGKTETFSGDTLEAAVDSANLQAEKKETQQEEKKVEALGTDGINADKYLVQGFNIHEIENAQRLAEASGVSMDQILSEKKSGKDWEDIIHEYSQAGEAQQP